MAGIYITIKLINLAFGDICQHDVVRATKATILSRSATTYIHTYIYSISRGVYQLYMQTVLVDDIAIINVWF